MSKWPRASVGGMIYHVLSRANAVGDHEKTRQCNRMPKKVPDLFNPFNPIVYLIGSFLVVITLAVSEGHCKTPPAELSEEKDILLGILPNGLAVLPDCDSHRTPIFSFAYGKLQRNPFLDSGREPKSGEEFLQIIRKRKIGDLMYDDAEGGSLVACTNRIKLLGKGLLKEVSVTAKPEIPKKDWIPARVGGK